MGGKTPQSAGGPLFGHPLAVAMCGSVSVRTDQ